MRAIRSSVAATLAVALAPAGAAAIGAVDVGARGGAGAILGTGGDGPNIVVLGILLFAGLAFVGHVFGLVSGLLRWDREKIAASASGAAATLAGLVVFFALWFGAAAGIAAVTGWSAGATVLGFVVGAAGYLLVFMLGDRAWRSFRRAG